MSLWEHAENRPPANEEAEVWECLVIGAGPAGAVAAALLAERGWRVMLVERSGWPREKACGGCLNAAAVGLLERAGLAGVLARCGGAGRAITRLSLRMGRRRLEVPLPMGMAIERREFDALLVDEAVARGCFFVPETAARVLPLESPDFRTVRLACRDESRIVRAKVVLACDGLGGNSLPWEPWAKVERDRRIRLGFSSTLGDRGMAEMIGEGAIAMHVGDGGYVGLVRLGADRVHIGASLSPALCNRKQGPAEVIREILAGTDYSPAAGALPSEFMGTGPLCACRPCVAGTRVMAIGDACGYVEPFTGEGISWAIRGAMEAVSVLPGRADAWDDGVCGRWQGRYEREIRDRQRWCRRMRMVLHRPGIAAACMNLAAPFPRVAAGLARRISA